MMKMSLFRKRNPPEQTARDSQILYTAPRASGEGKLTPAGAEPLETELYSRLRRAVPILDAAIQKIIRLTGSFQLLCSDPAMQPQLEHFARNVPVGAGMRSLQSFADIYLDSLLTWGNGLGEICIDSRTRTISALICGDPSQVVVTAGKRAGECSFSYRNAEENGQLCRLPHPERILFTALSPPAGQIMGVSVLSGLPALSQILLRIYECIGQNFDRCGNVRYAVVYHPSNDPSDRAYAGERARAIAAEWSAGMAASSCGEVRDFVCAGDVEIKVIGAENQLLSTEIPVRQLLEQMIAKLSIPPFLLGLNWSSTERMSSQQADILTSELEYYRRLLEPVLCRIAETFLRLNGSDAVVTVEWSNINLQDETALAQARLWNAQAQEIEARLAETVSL